jgi:hypothetical protein
MVDTNKVERRTINLWPDAGQQLGLGKNATYEAALRGQIPGVLRIGSRWLVLRDVFERAMRGEIRIERNTMTRSETAG